jgi:stress-induced morphogen
MSPFPCLESFKRTYCTQHSYHLTVVCADSAHLLQRHAVQAIHGSAESDGNAAGDAPSSARTWEPTEQEPKPVAASIQRKLEAEFKPASLEVVDESHKHAGHAGSRETISPSGETHFKVSVVSESFVGMNQVKRHRAVFGLLKEELSGPVHALSLDTKTPAEVS